MVRDLSLNEPNTLQKIKPQLKSCGYRSSMTAITIKRNLKIATTNHRRQYSTDSILRLRGHGLMEKFPWL